MRAKPSRGLSDRQLLDCLRRAAGPAGIVTLRAVNRMFSISADPFKRRFGSWRAAVELAGLRQSPFARDQPGRAARRPERPPQSPSPLSRRAPGTRLRLEVLRRDLFRCSLCGDSPALTPGCVLEVDHIRPWSRGGRSAPENLRTLCRACNRGKAARPEPPSP